MVDDFFKSEIKKNFDFLVEEYTFSNPIFYNVAYEYHAAYIKDNFFINIAFDGNYWCTIEKSQKLVQDILLDKRKINELDHRKFVSYPLSYLDIEKKLYNSIQNFTGHEKELFYYATLLRNNPDVLNGNFRKFSFCYLLLKKIGF